MRDKLIQAGIRHLKEFGYPDVDAENIVTDLVYGAFFKRMLEETIEDATGHRYLTEACQLLVAEIDAAQPKEKPKKRRKE